MPTSKTEYLAHSRRTQPGFGVTADFTDNSVGATVQSPDGIPPAREDIPGQRFLVEQLPDPEVAIAYGLPAPAIPEYLILDGDGDDDPQGPDLANRQAIANRKKLGNPTLAYDGTIQKADVALESFLEATGATGATEPAGDKEPKGDPEKKTPARSGAKA